jgi:predicted dehydrogenase
MSALLRVGLVGAGGIAGLHLPAYHQHPDRVVLTAVCDVAAEAAQRRAAEAGGAAVYSDFTRFLAEADVDAVDLCTVPDQHASQAITAAAAGKHVLVEKPMACSLDECRAMVAAAEAADVTLMVGQMQRYDPSYRGLRRLIQAGELGTLRAVRLDALQNGPDGMGHVGWIFDGQRAGGGVVMSVAVHKLDLMRYLVGEVARVTAVTR